MLTTLSFVISLSVSATTSPVVLDTEQLSEVSHLRGEVALKAWLSNQSKTTGQNFAKGGSDTLIHVKRFDLHTGYIIRAMRAHQGIPVLQQTLAARFSENGKLSRLNHDFSSLNLPSLVPSLDKKAAQLRAIDHVWAMKLPREMATGEGPKTKLVLSAQHQALVYAVWMRGLQAGQDRVVLVDAQSGHILETRSLARFAEAPGTAYLPHPSPTGELGTPEAVTLTRLNAAEAGSPMILEGTHVNASNCLTDNENVRILTCDDALPIFAGDFLPAGTTCSSSLVASLIPAEYKHLAIAICGTGHVAQSVDGSFASHEPVAGGAAITAHPFPAFHEAFSEVQLYHHVNEATEWFRALGHPDQGKPLAAMCNVSMPGQELMSCANTGMASADATDHETGVEVVTDCLDEAANNNTNAFGGFDNAFFMGGGSFTQIFGYEDGGLFMGQGTQGDFAYDGDVLYHELGHAIVGQIGALQSGNLLDSTGLNSSPGALNEAYADYFSSAITGDPVVGGYIGNLLTGGNGIRTMDHNEVCPDYWVGEVHEDAHGWAAALWDARGLYPQTEVNAETGLTVRVFDRAVYEGLLMLTSNMFQDDAARETIEAVKAVVGLEDPEAELVTGALEARNVIACERIRALSTDQPLEMMFFEGAGSSGGANPLGGGVTFSPYAPPPVQFSVNVKDVAGDNAECVGFSAILGQAGASSEAIPDLIGGGGGGPTTWNLALLWNADAPVAFTYSGTNVNTEQADNEVPVEAVVGSGMTTFQASVNFPEGATTLYLALVNRTSDGGVIGNIRLNNVNTNCPEPEPEETENGNTDDPTGGDENGAGDNTAGTDTESEDEEEDEGGCTSAKPDGLIFLLAGVGLLMLRRRFTKNLAG